MTNPDVDSLCLERQQFPVRLAFSITTNKAQGQALIKVGFYIDSPLFAQGRLYNALSRVSDLNSLKILIKKETVNSKTRFFFNYVVYSEVFK